MNKEEFKKVAETKKYILKGKRLRKFHEFTLFVILILFVIIALVLNRIFKVGFIEFETLLFIIVPLLFLIFWIPYKNQELNLKEKYTGFSTSKNQRIVKTALKLLGADIQRDDNGYIEAIGPPSIGLTWGNDMFFVLINKGFIYAISLSNLDSNIETQSFFTFGKLSRNIKDLYSLIDDEINKMEITDK